MILLFVGDSVNKEYKYYKGPMQCIRDIYANHGMRGFYKGFTVSIARDVPIMGVYFVTYEYLYAKFVSWGWAQRHSAAMNILAGGLAGVTFWTLVVPIDVIKSQVQAGACHDAPPGVKNCILNTYKRGGIRAFYTGLPVLLIRGFPVNAAIFVGYYQTLNFFNWFYGRTM